MKQAIEERINNVKANYNGLLDYVYADCVTDYERLMVIHAKNIYADLYHSTSLPTLDYVLDALQPSKDDRVDFIDVYDAYSQEPHAFMIADIEDTKKKLFNEIESTKGSYIYYWDMTFSYWIHEFNCLTFWYEKVK